MRRYDKAVTVFPFDGFYGVSYAIPKIREGIRNGTIRFKQQVLREGERLDVISATEYSDGRLSWILAAASGVGNIGQIPPGTLVRIPVLEDVKAVLDVTK